MRVKTFTILLCLAFFSLKTFSQCTTLGQTPQTAFPVCGTTVFEQATVPTCSNGSIYNFHCNDGVNYQDVNPFWYKFTCFKTGTLGFLITPQNLNDDYDWELFDITGHSVTDVYTTNLSLAQSIFVANNWSGNTGAEAGYTGITGTQGSFQLWECATSPPTSNATTYSGMPTIIQGHNYLLMVSHFSGSGQSGYGLSFSGGTGSITDTVPPRLKTASANCSADQIFISTNKSMQCKSVAVNGPVFDFTISPAVPNVKVIAESGVNCNNGFDMDSVVISLSNPLPPGNYQIIPQNGSDGNTLIDNCDTPIPSTDSIPLTILSLQPTPMDSITPATCSTDTLQLVFKKNIQCSSIAEDGSDFIITGGSAPVIIRTAAGNNCDNGVSNIIDVVLSSPLVHGGVYTITLKQGSDGNTIIDECNQQTPAGEFLNFTCYDTVSAAFNYLIKPGCVYDSILLSHDNRNNIDQWMWVFDGTDTIFGQNVIKTYTNFLGVKNIWLLVSNGGCTDTASINVQFNNYLKAMFNGPAYVCPNDLATFTDSSIGSPVNWYWSFGDGTISIQQNPPPQTYPPTPTKNDVIYPVELVVENNINCFDTSVNLIKVLYNCYIAVPSAFTPNGDGLNDYLYPLNAYKAINLEFSIYNRLGQLIFHTTNWQIKWDGTLNGMPQQSGTYVWILTYTDGDTGKKVFQKGTSVLIR